MSRTYDVTMGIYLTRDQLKDLVRKDLEGLDLVNDLLDERRAEAAAEDAA